MLEPGTPAAASAAQIRVRGLRKSYGAASVLRGLDLDVHRGEIVALVGPNGAGKTTAVEILEGYRDRDGGEVSVLGTDPARPTREWRSRIGLVLQDCQMPPRLTAHELLERYAGYYADPLPVDELLELVGLQPKASSRTATLSGGQRRRLDIALALVGDPDLVFLDEPTTGLDPSARRTTWDLVARLRDLGKTILLTTHYMEEAEVLADRVSVLVAGRIVADAPPDRLGGRDRGPCRLRFALDPGVDAAEVPELGVPLATEPNGDITVRTATPVETVGALLDWARGRNLQLPGLRLERPTLEDVYLDLIGGRR